MRLGRWELTRYFKFYLNKEAVYVNLTKNPESFTGYSGESANKVWLSIYNENCFKIVEHDGQLDLKKPTFLDKHCNEKRIFYRIVSGKHVIQF